MKAQQCFFLSWVLIFGRPAQFPYKVIATCSGQSAIYYATSVVYTAYLQTRASAVDCLKRLAGVAKSYGFTLHRLRLDNDSVFRSAAFHVAVIEMGIRL